MDLRERSRSRDAHPCRHTASATLPAVLAVVLGLAFALQLGLAQPADAGPRKFQFGVVSKEKISVADLQRMSDAGVKVLRITFNWNDMEQPRDFDTFKRPSQAPCSEARFPGFDDYDALVSAASDAGIKLLPVLLGTPPYVDVGNGRVGPTAPHSQGNGGLDKADYKCWVRRIVQRWGFGGDYFTTPAPEGDPTARPIGRWQIWNEPNLPLYAARGEVKPAEYGRLVKATTNSVRKVNPKATMVLAGMPERVRRGMSSETFLHRLYNVKKIRSKFEVVAMHPYGENRRAVKGVLKRTRKQLRVENDGRRPLWITETGYATEGQDGHFLVKTEEGQANQLRKTFRMYGNNRSRYRLGTVAWFSWKDEEPYEPSTEHWPDYAGLYRDDGSPKQSCDQFTSFTDGLSPCQPIDAPATASEMTFATQDHLLGLRRGTILPSPPP